MDILYIGSKANEKLIKDLSRRISGEPWKIVNRVKDKYSDLWGADGVLFVGDIRRCFATQSNGIRFVDEAGNQEVPVALVFESHGDVYHFRGLNSGVQKLRFTSSKEELADRLREYFES